MSNKKRIFDTIEQLNYEYNLNLSIPNDIPNGCNVIGWNIKDLDDVTFYKEDGEFFFFFSHYSEGWVMSESTTLDEEVSYDICNDYNYVYLRLEQKDIFTPDCLVGVETTKGFITCVIELGWDDIFKPSYYVYTTESLSKEDLYDVHSIKFFISDYSDDVVTFKKYVNRFYKTK